MLVIVVKGDDLFNQETQEFTETEGFLLRLEHSLASLSKWESKYQKPFLDTESKTTEEVLDYISFMFLDDASPLLVEQLSDENLKQINAYIESPQTATTFAQLPEVRRYRNETVTSEMIYYWMVAYSIPFTCETWHLNRLLALVKICNIKQGPQKKMTKAQTAQKYREINAKRKAELGTSG